MLWLQASRVVIQGLRALLVVPFFLLCVMPHDGDMVFASGTCRMNIYIGRFSSI